jgi:hypothetical protein
VALLRDGDGYFLHGHFVHGIYRVWRLGSASIWWYQFGLFLNKPADCAGDDWVLLRRFYLRGTPKDLERLEDRSDHFRAVNIETWRRKPSESRGHEDGMRPLPDFGALSLEGD